QGEDSAMGEHPVIGLGDGAESEPLRIRDATGEGDHVLAGGKREDVLQRGGGHARVARGDRVAARVTLVVGHGPYRVTRSTRLRGSAVLVWSPSRPRTLCGSRH